MSSFDFPRLSRRDIIELLSSIATVSESNLLHPDPDFIFNLYALIVLCIEGQQDEPDQMEFRALEQLDFPDYHINSVPRMNLFNKIHKLVSALSCPYSFTPKDLIKPDPDRTEIFLGALLNFNAYREMKLSELKPHVDELLNVEERRQAAEARISELNEEIAECEEARESELPLIEELSSKVRELNNSVAELNKHQVKLKSSLKELKDKEMEMDAKVQTAEYELVQAAQGNATLRAKIVQSPDKLQRAFEDKKVVLNQTKNAERAALKNFQDKTAQLEGYDEASKKMTKLLSQMQSVQEQVNQAKTVDKDTKVLKNKLSDDGVVDKSLEAKIVELQAEENRLVESEKQLDKEISQRLEEATRELTNVKKEVGLKRQALESRQKQVESVVAEADAITSQIRIVKEEGDAKMQGLEFKSKEISEAFHRYTKNILDSLAAN